MKVVAENPNAPFGEITKILGEKWRGISDERKANYVAKAAQLKAEYDVKVAAAAKKSSGKTSSSKPAAKPVRLLALLSLTRACPVDAEKEWKAV